MDRSISLNSLEDVYSLIAKLNGSDPTFEVGEIKFGADLLRFQFGFYGEIYDKVAITGENARAIADFQSAIYRIGALILKGEDNGRRLTKDEIASLSLQIEIREGSTLLDTLFDKTFGLFSEGLKDMESKHKAIVLCFATLVLAGAATTYYVMDSLNTKEFKQSELEAKVALEEEQTKQMQLTTELAKSVNSDLVKVVEIHQEAIKGIVKSASEASKVTAGGVTFTSENIAELNQRSSRTTAVPKLDIIECVILNISTKDSSLTKLTLSETSTGIEYSALYDDNEYTEEENEFLWRSARLRKKVTLTVNKVLIDGSVKNAQIIGVSIPDLLK